jgi:hypothetical protein
MREHVRVRVRMRMRSSRGVLQSRLLACGKGSVQRIRWEEEASRASSNSLQAERWRRAAGRRWAGSR